MNDYSSLKQYCKTDRQREIVDACANGSQYSAAEKLSISRSTVKSIINTIKYYAAMRGHSPKHDMNHTVPDGYKVKGVSTYYNDEGKPIGQWVKSSIDLERSEYLRTEAFKALGESLPRHEPVDSPKSNNDKLCNLYTLTDCHVGMLSWKTETGESWDLNIAEHTLVKCFHEMLKKSPDSKYCVIAQLGDYLHFDGLNAVTPTSGNVLDVDGRFSKVVQAGIRILRRIVTMSLEKHEHVTLVIAEGNHDMASSIWLRVMFRALFENEPRIKVIDSEGPYYAIIHGKTLLSFHHGHLKKNSGMPILIASRYPRMWGETNHRYIHVGHLHHGSEVCENGATLVQHTTLSARDSYSHRHGYVSERSINGITYHSEYGQVAKITITPEMIL
jgi:hypothetical protein